MDPVQTLIQALEHARLSNSIAIGVVAIWLYDWLSALPLEVELIWKSRWGLVKSIFIFGRVLFPLHSISTLIYVHSSVLTKAECHSVFAVGSISGVAHSFLAEAVIYLQVYALSQGNRWMGIFLGIQFVAFAIAVAILQALFFKSMAYMVLPFEGFHCIPFKFHNGVATATYNAAIATESVIVLITFWIVYRKYGHSRSRMLQVLLRDGLLYMHGIVLLSTANTIIAYRAPDTLKFILGQYVSFTHQTLECPPSSTMYRPKGVFTHILFTRLILHLRSKAAKDVELGHSGARGANMISIGSNMQFASHSSRFQNSHLHSHSSGTAGT
ncbi:hypothetical protein CC2G_009832 [Coprinopsis cinerea AmutBmut pab1-1]|nr:hypothetical protein CC2G_009832 [Coprinopsis cinerea AmutBmut pab1-1]